MIDLQVIIDRLEAQTDYTIEKARQSQPNLQELYELPIIYVGYVAIVSKHPDAILEHDVFNTYGEDLTQVYEIQIVCEMDDLPTVWKNVYKALVPYTPFTTISGTASTSGFTYLQGSVIQLLNSKVIHADKWCIGFPTIPVII